MTRAAELIIQALLPRKAAPMLERHTGLPYGWGLWLRALPERLGMISRDKSEAIVSDLVARPPRPPGAITPALGFWRGLRSLFYQDWDPPPREERGIRWLAGFTSLLMHLLFLLLLVWVAVVRLPPQPAEAGDSSRVQVEFVGRGTPEETGGGAPQATSSPAAAASGGEAASQEASTAPTPRRMPEIVPPSPTLATETPQVREREVSEPAPQPPQPVQVTETPEPPRAYVLPAPNLRRDPVTAPTITPREMSVPQREVTVVETPTVPRVDTQRGIAAPQLTRPVPQVQEREVAAPLPQVRTAQVPTRVAPVRDLQRPAPGVREREIAAPSTAATTGSAASASTPAPSVSRDSGAGSQAATPASTSGVQPGATRSGPAQADRSGGWATPQRGDDWGASRRNVAGDSGANAGQKPGLFNADGSVRVPTGAGDSGPATADRGAPGGGNDQWTREKIDSSGTWLQRAPYDYEPTSFDKYWVPNESLLAEWVRRNIREAVIPIPGTSKKIRCVVSVLQLGGGCGLFDPNLNEQPASARPPPEIPTKRTPIPTDS